MQQTLDIPGGETNLHKIIVKERTFAPPTVKPCENRPVNERQKAEMNAVRRALA